jgi:nucleoid-associated protein EbfC
MSDEPSFDINALLGQAMEMQQKIQAAQQSAALQTFTGSAAGGAVQIDVSGSGEFVAVRLQASVVDPSDVSMLEDLVLAALRDSSSKVAAANAAAMGNIGLPAGLSGLGGGLG